MKKHCFKRCLIEDIRFARKGKLKGGEDLFTGRFWTGRQSIENGLVDGLGSRHFVAREIIGEERIISFMPQGQWYEQISKQFGASMERLFMSFAQWKLL